MASTNVAKAKATRQFLLRKFGVDVELLCLDVASGVRPTPFSNEEGLLGARNRVAAARQCEQGADFYIGAEGCVFPLSGKLMLGGWVVVEDCRGVEYVGSSCFVELPQGMVTQLTPDQRLSEIVVVSDYPQVGTAEMQELGTNGLLTRGEYTRVMEFEDALRIAFSRIAPRFSAEIEH